MQHWSKFSCYCLLNFRDDDCNQNWSIAHSRICSTNITRDVLALTIDRHLSQSWARWINSTSFYPTLSWHILIIYLSQNTIWSKCYKFELRYHPETQFTYWNSSKNNISYFETKNINLKFVCKTPRTVRQVDILRYCRVPSKLLIEMLLRNFMVV
jgi:hypothetical protein